VIFIPFYILESEYFPLPQCLIIWPYSHEIMHAMPIFEPWEMQSGVFFHQHVVIVCLHAFHLDPTLDIFVRCIYCKRVIRIVFSFLLEVTLSGAFPSVGKVIYQQRRRRDTFLSVAADVAVVEKLSLQCFQGVRGKEMHPSLQLNLC
jgi:hypothetical protein